MEEPRIGVVIEDDPDIRSLVADILENAGFDAHTAAAGLEGVELVRRLNPLVTTLDVSMPGMDGFETAKRIRAFSSTYLLMLTSRTEEIDTLQGLQSGADDYVTKPFRPRELRARIEAMMRRPRMVVDTSAVQPAEDENEGWLEHQGVRVHPGMRLATVEGVTVELTRSEFDILAEIIRADHRVVSKTELALIVRDDRGMPSDFVNVHDERAIEVHIANLRRKIGDSSAQPRWIETVRGAGYRLTL
ncbi:response regulator transcription factor [Microbacterium nanhaiense]|uniref:response regulator transcription factor n=1 Tax=Microbacterium nanhaiense TaxID=1301026 RepID=UPI001669E7FD|nr:response regulator transcription factor [Microbacterium nanhaiense]